MRRPASSTRHSEYKAGIYNRVAGPYGLPLTKPPYGRITAIDMRTGEHVWMSPVGRGPVDHPQLWHLDLPDLGWENRSFAVATSSLLLVASQDPRQQTEHRRRRRSATSPLETLLRAFDLDTGAQVGEIDLPANAYGSPMTYMVGGRQFIVVPIDDQSTAPELVALSLPH